MEEVSGIYKVTNIKNGKVYVGQSIHIFRRFKEHLNSARRGDKSPLYAAIRKHGDEQFVLEVLEECGPHEFDDRECHWMEAIGSRHTGYNLLSGGQNGRIMDAKTREHLSSMIRGRKLSPEHVEQIRAANTGRKHTEEAKAKISAANKGLPRSKETLEKLSTSLSERYRSLTDDERAMYAAKRSGWSQPEHVRVSTRERFKGKPKTPEQRARMSAAAKNRSPEAEERRVAALRAAFAKKRADSGQP
jgi:group I intron endonuclease